MANYSDEIEVYNSLEVKPRVGAIVVIITFMVFGIFGNILVLYVYTFRMNATSHRIFIIVLAVLDLLSCTVSMPFIIMDMFHRLTFNAPTACKILRFFLYFFAGTSAYLLLLIAIDRYLKTCRPLGQQITPHRAKLLSILMLFIGTLTFWPAPVLFGHSTVETPNPNIKGVSCYLDDAYKDTYYLAYWNGIMIFLVLVVFSGLIMLYYMIARSIRRQVEFRKRILSNRPMKTNIGQRQLDQTDQRKTGSLKNALKESGTGLQNSPCKDIASANVSGGICFDLKTNLDITDNEQQNNDSIDVVETYQVGNTSDIFPVEKNVDTSFQSETKGDNSTQIEKINNPTQNEKVDNSVKNETFNVKRDEGPENMRSRNDFEFNEDSLTEFYTISEKQSESNDTFVEEGQNINKLALDVGIDKPKRVRAMRSQSNYETFRRMQRSKRITQMFFVLTLTYSVTFIPHLILKLITTTQNNFVASLPFAGQTVYHITIHCSFLNSMINCYVYGFFDTLFMKELKNLCSAKCTKSPYA